MDLNSRHEIRVKGSALRLARRCPQLGNILLTSTGNRSVRGRPRSRS